MKKIVVLGPESTGKSTLCEQLAAHYQSEWVPEYARAYLMTNGTEYSEADLWEIAQGQISSEDEQSSNLQNARNNTQNDPLIKPLFIDTDLYVIKIWSEIVFNSCDNRILNGIVRRDYDLYLLCDTDLPWVADELREYPDLQQRRKIYQFYLDAMVNQKVPWVNISGDYEERFQKAVGAIDAILR